MEHCSAAPYLGAQPFVYVHYARRDVNEAFTLIERLARRGMRIYYDTGEGAAQERTRCLNERMEACAMLFVLLSADAVSAHDFRKVVTTAKLNNARLVAVYLDETPLSFGMKLQLEKAQSVSNPFTDAAEESLAAEARAAGCMGPEDSSVRVLMRPPKGTMEGEEKKTPLFNVSVILEDESEILRRFSKRKASETEQTAVIEEPIIADPSERRQTLVEEPQTPLLFVRLLDGACRLVNDGSLIVGRSSACGFVLHDGTVSGRHVELSSVSDSRGELINVIRDSGSSNGTWVDGVRLDFGKAVRVSDTASVSIGRDEDCFAAFADAALRIAERGMLDVLQCRETGEWHAIPEGGLDAGRGYPWARGAFDDRRISWMHARIDCDADGCAITDVGSTNGTLVNGNPLARHQRTALLDGDEITMGRQHFVYHALALRVI